jgi:Uma2 family endonuclease
MTDVVSYDPDMRTLVLDSSLEEIEALLANRRRSGIDRFDEVWDGVLHVVPMTNHQHGRIALRLQSLFLDPAREVGLEVFMQPFNLGAGIRNFRVPDGALFPAGTDGLWFTTAPMVVEIVSTHDQSWEKLPFFGTSGVNEVLIIDPRKRQIDWLVLRDGEYVPTEHSTLIDFSAERLAAELDW